MWSPNSKEWTRLTEAWLRFPLYESNLPIPEAFRKSDVIVRPLSSDQGFARRKDALPIRSPEIQLACVSHESCQRLAASLVAIIYLSRGKISAYQPTMSGIVDCGQYHERITVPADGETIGRIGIERD